MPKYVPPCLIEEQKDAEFRREEAAAQRSKLRRIKSAAFRKRLHIDQLTRLCKRHGVVIDRPEGKESRPRYTCERCFAEACAELGTTWTERAPGSAGPNIPERGPANLGRIGDMRADVGLRQGAVRE